MDSFWGYGFVLVVAPPIVVLSLLKRIHGDYTWREKFAFCLPAVFIVELIIIVVFLGSDLSDIIVIAKGRHAWGIFMELLALTGVLLFAFAGWNYMEERRRPYSIISNSDDATAASQRYKQRIVLTAKALVVWLLFAVLAFAWLNRIANGVM